VQGTHQPRPGDVLSQRRQPGPPVLLSRRLGLPAGGEAEEGTGNTHRMVSAGYSRLMLLIRAIAGTLPMLLLLLGTSSASAQTPAEFFKGKQIALLVGFGPGGEDDLWARLLSRHLTTHIPGNPNVIPQNIPGSAGLLVANRLYNTAPRDGSVIGMINRGIPFEPLLGGQGTQFDPLKINYIGSPGRDTTVCAARKDAPVQSVEDLYRRELTVGGT